MDAPELDFRPSTDLRKKAEEHLQTKSGNCVLPTPSMQDASAAIHELRVHQIELELQNEELRRTQLLLEISNARYQTLYDRAPVGYLTLDGNGVMGDTNLAAANLLGSVGVMLRGRLLSDFIAPDDQDTFYHYRRLLFQLQSPGTIELRVTAANQGVRWVRLEGVVEQNAEGNPEGRLVLSDQTTRKLAEDQTRRALIDLEAAYRVQEKHLAELTSKTEELARERNRAEAATQAKSLFLSSMSHEIRTPMNGVVGMAQLLWDTSLSEEQRRYTETLLGAARALLGILDDILDIAKIEAGKFAIAADPFDLHALLEDLGSLLAPRAAEKGLDLLLRYAPSANRIFVGDAGRIRQVVLNLLWNAIKFTTQGHVLVEMGETPSVPGTARVWIAVHDTGVGIPLASQPRIFEEFEQMDSHPSRNCAGTGLGLAISRTLARRMGGSLRLASEEGAGSTFTFELTLPLAPGSAAPEFTDGRLSRMDVLVVDSHAVRRAVTMEMCSRWGMRVDGVSSLAEVTSGVALSPVGEGRFILVEESLLAGASPAAMDQIHAGQVVGKRAFLIGMVSPDHSKRRPDLASQVKAIWAHPLRESVMVQTMLRILDDPHVAEDSASPLAPPVVELAPDRQPRLACHRVLVMEDDHVSQQVILGLLGKLDCHVDVVSDGALGCQLAERNIYDLILADCHMPTLDGLEATKQIRAREGRGRHTPVVAMTADATEANREDCRLAGMDDFLSKPVSMTGLRALLTKWVGTPKLK